MSRIIIIDYGSGNIRSVFNDLKKISNKSVKISSKKEDLKSATHLILPGVGSFESCVNGLKKSN